MPRANSLPRNTLSISVLQALQNTGDKFSNGERSNQIRHGDRERLPACTIQDTLYFMSCAGRDKWVSVAEGIVEIWRCKEVVSAASPALTSKPVPPSVLHGKVIWSMCRQPHTRWCTMTAVAKSSYTLYWAYLCHTPQTASPCPSTALWKRGEAKLLTTLPAAGCTMIAAFTYSGEN